MTHQERPFLILLVGANPLPNYLVACALRPRRLALLYTDETEKAMRRLSTVLQEKLRECVDVAPAHVSDATCATTVERVIQSLLQAGAGTGGGNVWLNYTGGTKVMAAHARLAFQEAAGADARRHASYLDEGGASQPPRLRFDNGDTRPLKDYPGEPLSLATILALHGITHEPRTPWPPPPTLDDAREILRKVLQRIELANELYCERRRLECKDPDDRRCNKKNKPDEKANDPFIPSNYGLTLSQPRIPAKKRTSTKKKEHESWYKQWYKFIGGEWLEEWLGEQIRGIGLSPKPEITIGFNAWRGAAKAQLEIDVAVIRGHRSYFISCTTDTTKDLCKSKLFEVAVRSRQLGGDLSRAALVCLADDEIVGKLQADIDDLWGSINTTRVFGRSEVACWSGHDDTQPNLRSLEDWLHS